MNCGDSLIVEQDLFQSQGGGAIPTSPLQFKKEDWKVLIISKQKVRPWLLYKHYAHRIPPIQLAFGLYHLNKLVGVCSFGTPPRCFNNGYAAFNDYKMRTLELNRLVVNDGLIKNALSFFVSKCLVSLPKPLLILSYADPNVGHSGYIYQATNWVYTGIHEDYIVKFFDKDGNDIHARTIVSRYGTADRKIVKEKFGINSIKQTSKHRYFKFLGDKKQIKIMKNYFKLPIKPYPKGDNKRYDASYEVKDIENLL